MTEVERIARLLCEGDGCEPDFLVLPNYEPPIGPFGRRIIPPEHLVPAWTLYEQYVQATLDAAGDETAAAAPPPAEPAPKTWRERYSLT